MAGITLEGKLWIELADVYAWLESRGTDTEGAKRLRFDIGSDALVVEFGDKGAVEIDAVEFWAWVIDKQLPGGLAHCETLFGVPKEEGPDLVVSFAAGSEGNPRSWGVPPACLAEWNQTAAVAADNLAAKKLRLASVPKSILTRFPR